MPAKRGARGKAPVKTASGFVQRRKRNSRGKSRISWAVLFWLVFAIFIFGLFLFNREAISNSVQIIQNAIASRNAVPVEREPVSGQEIETEERIISVRPPAVSPAPGTDRPSTVQPTPQPPSEAASQNQNTQLRAEQTPQAGQNPQVGQGSSELRERPLYFTQVDRGGSILRVKVDRKFPVSDSPLTDVVQALLAGPDGDERNRGLISLIPPGTQILSALVRGNTAYISFSEDFQYNTYGVEGYAGQLRQIVFTVTEFPNVRDVQILIEGRRVDYLGEGIWIGSPLNRDML